MDGQLHEGVASPSVRAWVATHCDSFVCVWEKFLRNGQSMFYLDNEAAREVLLDSATPIESGGWLEPSLFMKCKDSWEFGCKSTC